MSLQGLYKKSIYPQTGLFSALVSTTVNFTSGLSCEFGFSGNNSVISFPCQSGYIFNRKNNEGIDNWELIDSYSPGKSFIFSGDFSERCYNVTINNSLKMIGERIPSTGYFDYFYFNAINGIDDVSLTFRGAIPQWSYQNYATYLSGNNILFNIYNNSIWPFKVYSGEVLANTGAFSWSGSNYITVSGNGTGQYGLLVNNFLQAEREIPLLLHTNFGNINLYVTGSGYSTLPTNFGISISPTITSISDGDTNTYLTTWISNTGMFANISLEYISGITGDIYNNAFRTGVITGEVTGYISGCGFITGVGTYTGWISGYNPILSGYESGIGTGINTVRFWTCNTGNITGTGTGLATGYITTYTGTRYFSGIWDLITGDNITNVDYRSGNYLVAQNRYYKSSIGGSTFGNGNSYIYTFVTYDSGNISGSGIYDLVRLLVTGDGIQSGLHLYITGTI